MSKKETIKWAKLNESAIIPTKNDEDAGYDIYANFEEGNLVIRPHTTVLVPTKIAVACPKGYYFQVEERGSTGKYGIKKSAGIIDSGYRGEIFVAITNINTVPVIIHKRLNGDSEKVGKIKGNSKRPGYEREFIYVPYDKAIAQLILHKIENFQSEEISYEELKEIPSIRGTGKLGSSKK